MAKLSINERLAQLISEKNMGLKTSSVVESPVVKTEAPQPVVKPPRGDVVELKNIDGETQEAKISVAHQQKSQNEVVSDGNPFIHNQVVDDIAKKLLKAFVGS